MTPSAEPVADRPSPAAEVRLPGSVPVGCQAPPGIAQGFRERGGDGPVSGYDGLMRTLDRGEPVMRTLGIASPFLVGGIALLAWLLG